jgi:hypothetical protein
MSLNELTRHMASYKRRHENELKEKATFDYIMAELLGRSLARLQSNSARMPEIYEIYPTLFNSDEIREKQADFNMEKSIIRFKKFAVAHNLKYKGVRDN